MMGGPPEEIRNIFQNFRWIDNIPEDQVKTRRNLLAGEVALLLEANINNISRYINRLRLHPQPAGI